MSKVVSYEQCRIDSIKLLLNPKKIDIKIKTLFGSNKIKSKTNIMFTRLDINFPNNPTVYSSFTDEEGLAKLNSILEGAYLIQIKKGRYYREELHLLENNETITFKLPRFQIFKKYIKANDELVQRLNWLYRFDSKYCFICKTNYQDNKRYYCKRCGKHFCQQHRIPENHGCKENLNSPTKDFRTIYSRGETEIRY
jgi:hypothetical protein